MVKLETAQKIFSPLLLPLARIYGLVMRLRALAFSRGVFVGRRVAVPVICVGNITCGGSGKTPVTRHLCEFIQTLGRRPAIVSRGYRGRAGGRVNLVSDGLEVKLSVGMAGDEPLMLARALPGVPVITSRRRYDGAAFAVDELSADIVVLDDGFQHLSLARDLDLVLFAATTLAGNGRLLPAGILREGEDALARAHAFIITGVGDRRADIEMFKLRLERRFPGRPVFLFGLGLDGFVDSSGNSNAAPEPGTKVFAFCGLADPVGFRRSLIDAGLDPVGFRAFADHYQYTPADFGRLEAEATSLGARILVTTEKDMVKIAGIVSSRGRAAVRRIPLLALLIKVVPDPAFATFIHDRIGGRMG